MLSTIGYRKWCPRLWLCFHANSSDSASHCHVGSSLLTCCISSSVDYCWWRCSVTCSDDRVTIWRQPTYLLRYCGNGSLHTAIGTIPNYRPLHTPQVGLLSSALSSSHRYG